MGDGARGGGGEKGGGGGGDTAWWHVHPAADDAVLAVQLGTPHRQGQTRPKPGTQSHGSSSPPRRYMHTPRRTPRSPSCRYTGASRSCGPEYAAEEAQVRLAQAVRCRLPLIGVWLVLTPSSQPARPRSGARSRTPRSDTIPLWRFQASSDITGFILGPERAAVLYVLTKNGVVCLDAATGAQRWGRDDLPFVPPAGFALTYGAADAPPAPIRGLALGEERMAILDLVTGDKVSESSSWSVDAPRGFLPLPGPDLFLLVAKTSGNKRALLGVAPEKGDVRWRQDKIGRAHV